MSRVGTNRDLIKNELYNIKDYHGIADTYTIDRNRDVLEARFIIKEIKDGKAMEK